MNGTKDTGNDDETLLEDEERLLESYKTSHKKFGQYFGILMGFSLIFLFIILFPYISTIESGYTNQKNLNTTISNITTTKNVTSYVQQSEKAMEGLTKLLKGYNMTMEKTFLNLMSTLMVENMQKLENNTRILFDQPQSSQDISNVYKEFNSSYDKLRLNRFSNMTLETPENFRDCNSINNSLIDICNLKNKILFEVNQSVINIDQMYPMEPFEYQFPDCNIVNLTRESWMKCNFNLKIQHEANQMNHTLDNVTLALKRIQDEFIPSEDIQTVYLYLRNLVNQSYDLKNNTSVEMMFNAQNEFKRLSDIYLYDALKNIEAYIESLKSKTQTKLEQLNQTQNELLVKINNTLNNKEKIADRLSQIQFPFGKLPITLNESIAIFPIALGIGFIICCIYIIDSIRLRKQLHNLYKIKYKSSNKELLKKRTLLLTPLWIDPVSSKCNIVLKFTIFMIPVLIFVISSYAIIFYILFTQSDLYESLFYYESLYVTHIFLGLYVFCIILFVAGTYKVLSEIWKYRSTE